MQKIPLYKPYITAKERDAVLRVLDSGVLSRGPEVERFEDAFADYVGKKYAIAVSSGTTGLHVAIRTLGWKNGDEVITTPFSFIASGNALLFENIHPIFADIREDYNVDPIEVKKKITKKTKGILLVHIFGLPAYSKELKDLISENNLDVIEDACEALAPPNSTFKVSKLGKCTVYGFYENKPITSGGEGGMIVTNDEEIAEKCRSLRDQGRLNHHSWLNHIQLGYNYRMTELQAAFGRAQLKRLDWMLQQREMLAERYNTLLAHVDGLTVPPIEPKRSWFLYTVQFKSKVARDKAMADLRSHGIGAKEYFPPIHLFAHFKEYGYKPGDFPVTEHAADTTLAIPFFIGMTYQQQDEVATIIVSSLK